jgi:hypothetical protein
MRRVVLGTAIAFAVSAGNLQAQRLGAQLSWGDDSDLGLGVRLEAGLPNLLTNTGALSRTYFIGSFDYFFIDCRFDCSYWEINANLAVPVVAATIDPYLGAGLNIAHISIGDDDLEPFDREASDTDLGVNLLGGLRFPIGNLSSFLELRGELGGGDQLVLTFGFLFGS